MNAAELISNAFYLSGIRSRTLQNVTDTDTSDGLELLNDILAEKSIDGDLINYYSHAEFDSIVGQEEYTIPGLIEIDSLTFNIDDVRYKMKRDTRRSYFGDNRVDNLKSLPFHYFPERILGGMKIYLYFVPDQIYQMKITGKYSLDQILDPSQDISNLERFYISYLKFELANRLCNFFDFEFNIQNMSTLSKLERKISNMVGIDLSIEKTSMFKKMAFDPYYQVNIEKGWTP